MNKTIYSTLTILFLFFSFSTFSQVVPQVVTGTCTDSAGSPIANNPVHISSDTDPVGVWTSTDVNGVFMDSLGVTQGDTVTVMALDCDSVGWYFNYHGASGLAWDTIVSNFFNCGVTSVICNGSYTANVNGAVVTFTAQSNIPGATYLWDFGDGNTGMGSTVVHTYASSGYYWACVTGSNMSCTFHYCDTMVISNPSPQYSLGGQVSKNGNIDPGIQGTAFLLVPDSSGMGPWTALDATSLDSGFYLFTGVAPGDYHVLALLDPTDVDYGNYFPTYHFNSTTWSASNTIMLSANSYQNAIDLQPTTGPSSGPSNIGGTVKDVGLVAPGTAIEDAQVQLFDQNGNELIFFMTDAQGAFDFPDLAYGSYLLRVEIAGVPSIAYSVTTSASANSVNLLFNVSANGVLLNMDDIIRLDQVKVYPNPVKDIMQIELPVDASSEVSYQLTTSHGQLLEHARMNVSRLGLDLSGYPSGIYYLEVMQNGNSMTFKIIRE